MKKAAGQIVGDLSYTEKSDVDFPRQLTKLERRQPRRDLRHRLLHRGGLDLPSRRASWA
jgi:hypothetical protein